MKEVGHISCENLRIFEQNEKNVYIVKKKPT